MVKVVPLFQSIRVIFLSAFFAACTNQAAVMTNGFPALLDQAHSHMQLTFIKVDGSGSQAGSGFLNIGGRASDRCD
jgi:hypothetical protein